MKVLKIVFKSGAIYDYPVEKEILFKEAKIIIKNKNDYAEIYLNSIASYVVINNVDAEISSKTPK